MAKKTTPAGRKAAASSGSSGKTKNGRTSAAGTSKSSNSKLPRTVTTSRQTVEAANSRPPKAATTKTPTASRGVLTATVVAAPPRQSHKPGKSQAAPSDVLAKAEANISAAIESLNNQMNAAMATLTELAVAQRGGHEDYIRTAPLDRATATFQRLVGEVLDEHLAEILPTLVGLRNELADRACESAGQSGDDHLSRWLEMLDQTLTGAKVTRYDARPGEAFDPLIHLAVGEMHRGDLADGAVAEFIQPGFRTARGKVIAAAKVKVNRR
jgi:molecular chaperone GrpE (heat shock protein)